MTKAEHLLKVLNERSIAILPAYGVTGRKESIEDGIHDSKLGLRDGVVYAALRNGSAIFLSSHGEVGLSVGDNVMAHHDQNPSTKWDLQIQNVIEIENSKIKNSANDVGLKEKRPFYVFK